MGKTPISFILAAAFVVYSTGITAQRAAVTDQVIARDVIERLTSHDVTGVNVSVHEGIVTLRGSVPTLWMKHRAAEYAMKSPNVVTVVTELSIPRGESDERLAGLVAQRLQRYVFFTIFDDADVTVRNGVVTLAGRVTMPYKAEAFADLAAHVPGVQEVRNEIRTLPVSTFDDQLRYAVARRIYGDALFAQYAIQSNPPVHILVEHGAVTLTGVVHSDVERRAAEVIARGTFGVMSVTNKLRAELGD